MRILLKQALFRTPSLLWFTLAQMTWKWHKTLRVDVSYFLLYVQTRKYDTYARRQNSLHWHLVRMRNAQLNWWLNLLYRNQKYPSSKALISQLARNDDKVSLCSQIYKKLSSLILLVNKNNITQDLFDTKHISKGKRLASRTWSERLYQTKWLYWAFEKHLIFFIKQRDVSLFSLLPS